MGGPARPLQGEAARLKGSQEAPGGAWASEPPAEAVPEVLRKQRPHEEKQDPQARLLPWTLLHHPHRHSSSPFGSAASKGAPPTSLLFPLLRLVLNDGLINITNERTRTGAQSEKCLALDLSSGHDLTVREFNP